jgi:hypothetical protein
LGFEGGRITHFRAGILLVLASIVEGKLPPSALANLAAIGGRVWVRLTELTSGTGGVVDDHDLVIGTAGL